MCYNFLKKLDFCAIPVVSAFETFGGVPQTTGLQTPGWESHFPFDWHFKDESPWIMRKMNII